MLRIAQDALTFDDVLLVPGYSEVLPNQVSLKTRLTKGIELNVPLISAAMDTVTEARLAIAIAQEGGLGIVHKNLTIEEQAAEVRKVKKIRKRCRQRPDYRAQHQYYPRDSGSDSTAQYLWYAGC